MCFVAGGGGVEGVVCIDGRAPSPPDQVLRPPPRLSLALSFSHSLSLFLSLSFSLAIFLSLLVSLSLSVSVSPSLYYQGST